MLEVRLDSDTDPYEQFVWGERYIDDLVIRDRDTDDNGSLDERFYPCQDANWHITALVDDSGTVQERFAYESYGASSVLNANFTPKTGGTDYAWQYRFTSRELDLETALYYFRARYYHDKLGCFLTRDPLKYIDGAHLYAAYFVPNSLDPLGLLYVCCRPMLDAAAAHVGRTLGDIVDQVIYHCQLRNTCVRGERPHRVGVDRSRHRKLDGSNCTCAEASIADIERCLRKNMHSNQPRGGPPKIGDNCQTGSIFRLAKCCLTSQWTPQFIAGDRRGNCIKWGYRWRSDKWLDNGGEWERVCIQWEFEEWWKVPSDRGVLPVLPKIDDTTHKGWPADTGAPGIAYPDYDNDPLTYRCQR
ncbi:MAG: hypothetical protein KF861_14325 [Planctomycetaceae bacterium]|nr:hypothetical protein [Planctomycetaceae bacterium]